MVPVRTQSAAERIQTHWNDIPRKIRKELFYRFNGRLENLFNRLGLECQCTWCEAVMTYEQYLDNEKHCIECGDRDVATPY